MPSSDEITVPRKDTPPPGQTEREPDLREIDFRLKTERRRADWGYSVWLQIAIYLLLLVFVALSFAASMWVLSIIRQ